MCLKVLVSYSKSVAFHAGFKAHYSDNENDDLDVPYAVNYK